MNILEQQSLEDLESLAKIYHSPDLLLIGDGSGTTVNNTCGFSCLAYNVKHKQYVLHYGGFNHGTNNLAELMPYVQALWYDAYNLGGIRLDRKIEIISDSELTVKQGNGEYAVSPVNPNKVLWASIKAFEKDFNYTIHWNHVLRASNMFNSLCDKIAGKTRKCILEVMT